MTNKIEMTSQKKIVIVALISCFFLLIGLIMLGSNQSSDLGLADIVHSKTNAMQVSYDYPWWGLGSIREVTRVSGVPGTKNETTRYCNKRLVGGFTNPAGNSSDLEVSYSRSDTKSYNISAKAKAKINLFELEGGFAYTESETITKSIKYSLHPGKTLDIYLYDIKDYSQEFNQHSHQEIWRLNSSGWPWNWYHYWAYNGHATNSIELIERYVDILMEPVER